MSPTEEFERNASIIREKLDQRSDQIVPEIASFIAGRFKFCDDFAVTLAMLKLVITRNPYLFDNLDASEALRRLMA